MSAGVWRARVRAGLAALSPYHVPPVTVDVKLDANESPFPPPPELLAALAEAVASAPLHRYPDPRAARLRRLIASDLAQPEDRLVLGNGADELISLLCQTFAEPRTAGAQAMLVYPAPGFVVYRTAATAAGMGVEEAPLTRDFAADPAALEEVIARARPNLVFIATPNNPTGTVWSRAAVEQLVHAHPDIVMVIDQAYLAYGGEDLADLVDAAEHCVMLRTYSKIGLAGLRLGVLIARRELAHEVEKVRPPYNIGVLPQLAAELALGPFREVVKQHVAEIVDERARLASALGGLPGVEVFPSGANLLLVRVRDSRRVWQALLDRSVLVRYLGDAGALAGCLRITVGTPDENTRFLAAMRDAIS